MKAEGGKAVATGEEEKEKDKEDKDKKDDQKEKKAAAPKGETKELNGGVKIRDHKVGSGPSAKNGDMVSMRYVGKLQNGKVFDSNTKGAPVRISGIFASKSVSRAACSLNSVSGRERS